MNRNAVSDEKLLRQIHKGSEQALSAVIRRYTPYVSTIVWNIVGQQLTHSDAEEIIADVFISLWTKSNQTDGTRLKGFLGKIARNKAIDALRRSESGVFSEQEVPDDTVLGPEQTLTQREEAQAVRLCLDALPEPDRTIFLRHYYYGQTTTDIALAMDLNRNTVQSKLRRGRDKLRMILEEGGFFNA